MLRHAALWAALAQAASGIEQHEADRARHGNVPRHMPKQELLEALGLRLAEVATPLKRHVGVNEGGDPDQILRGIEVLPEVKVEEQVGARARKDWVSHQVTSGALFAASCR